MKKVSFSVVLAFFSLLLVASATIPAFAGGPGPELRLSNEKGNTAISRLGYNPRTVDTDRTATLFINDWTSQNAYKQYIEKQMTLTGQSQSWEGSVMSIFGSQVGILTPQHIQLSWLIADTPSDIRWQLFIKPRDDVYFQEVNISQPGSLDLWTNNGNNCWSLVINGSTVPEPGSLLALGSGLIGLIGFGLRRRR